MTADVDQCETCRIDLSKRQNRFHTVAADISTALLSSCQDEDCRSLVRSTQEQTLKQIERIDTQMICQQVGYCTTANSFNPSPIQLRLRNLVRHQTQTLDQRLETHDICSQFGQLKPMCEHLMSSPVGHRYSYVYNALLQNNTKWIDDDLREQMATNPNVDLCTTCKTAVQSAKDFWINSLVR
jgi:hypothetical protein